MELESHTIYELYQYLPRMRCVLRVYLHLSECANIQAFFKGCHFSQGAPHKELTDPGPIQIYTGKARSRAHFITRRRASTYALQLRQSRRMVLTLPFLFLLVKMKNNDLPNLSLRRLPTEEGNYFLFLPHLQQNHERKRMEKLLEKKTFTWRSWC